MSAPLFLVRLRNAYRWHYDEVKDMSSRVAAPIEQAFRTRTAAQAYIEGRYPLDCSPFDSQGWHTWQGVMEFSHPGEDHQEEETPEEKEEEAPYVPGKGYEVVPDESAIVYEEFTERVLSLGLPPVETPLTDANVRTVLPAWWRRAQPQMTEAQRVALWQYLDPEPYEIVEVEAYQ